LLDFRRGCELAFGLFDLFCRFADNLHLDEDGDRLAERCRVENGDVCPDDPILRHTLDPALDGGRGQADGFADRALRRGIVPLQDRQDFVIESIQGRF